MRKTWFTSHPAVTSTTTAAEDREKKRLAKRVQDGQFILEFEGFVARGDKLPPDPMVLLINQHYLRDLAPLRSPYNRAGAAGARCVGRRPVTPQLLLNARSFESVERHLAGATRDEDAHLERVLPRLLDLQQARRQAAAEASRAYLYRESMKHHAKRLSRLRAPSPVQRRSLLFVIEAQYEASRALAAATQRKQLVVAAERRALGLPPARPQHANRSRHRVAEGHLRFPRWWERLRQTKPLSDSRKGSAAPPLWKNLGESGFTYFAIGAAYRFGRVVAFSVNLTDAMIIRARRQSNPALWLQRRIDLCLKQKLKRKLQMHVCLEFNEEGALHAHGGIAGSEVGEEGTIMRALALAGGTGYRGKNQVDLKACPDSGWASYCAEDFDQPFPWRKRCATSEELRTAAEDFFDVARAFVLKHRADGVVPHASPARRSIARSTGPRKAVNSAAGEVPARSTA